MMDDMRVKLSTLWIFVMLNYIYADIITLMDGMFIEQAMTDNIGGMEITQGLFLGAAVLMEIPIAMVLLSRLLKYRANRWANIFAGSVKTVVMIATMFVGSGPTHYYLFFGTIEIACTIYIVAIAWRWTEEGYSLAAA